MIEGLLALSTSSGRYAIGNPGGRELTSGDRCEILLGGQWIAGSIEHNGEYAVEQHVVSAWRIRGYAFSADNGGSCGLCTGMKVRVS
jgi:hypothetical protein